MYTLLLSLDNFVICRCKRFSDNEHEGGVVTFANYILSLNIIVYFSLRVHYSNYRLNRRTQAVRLAQDFQALSELAVPLYE